MGSFTTSGTYGAHWHGDVNFWVNSQNVNANQSNVHVQLIMRADSGYSQSATTSYNVRLNGGVVNSGSSNVSLNGNSADLIDADVTVGHDANGNWSGSFGASLSSSYSGVGSGSGDYGISVSRLALAPAISSSFADTIQPTSVRLGTDISSYGHGTSAACRFYYRVTGTTPWSNTEDQNDITGNNYFSVTTLKPGTSYDYFVRWWNNNGDTADSTVQTFTTTSVPGMIPVLMGLL